MMLSIIEYLSASILAVMFFIFSIVTSIQLRFIKKDSTYEQRKNHLETHLYISIMFTVVSLFYLSTGYFYVFILPTIYVVFHLYKENEVLRKGNNYL